MNERNDIINNKEIVHSLIDYVPYGKPIWCMNKELMDIFGEYDYEIVTLKDILDDNAKYDYIFYCANDTADVVTYLEGMFNNNKPFGILTRLSVFNSQLVRDAIKDEEKRGYKYKGSTIQLLILNERATPYGDIDIDSYENDDVWVWICRWVLPKDIMIENI